MRKILSLSIGALLTASCFAGDWKTNEVVLIPTEKSLIETTAPFRVVMLVAQIQKTDPEMWQVLDLFINADAKPDWQILSNRHKGYEDAANFLRIPQLVSTADWDKTTHFTNKPFIHLD